MTILIVEKTEDNLRLLTKIVAEYYPMPDIIHCRSLNEALQWLDTGESPDLGFFEVELSEGISFEIFQGINLSFPVVFMSSYDKYWSQAMHFNAIDYLRKPIEKTEIIRVLDKYEALRNHFIKNNPEQQPQIKIDESQLSKNRLIAKKGTNYYVIKTTDIAFIYTESRIVFLIDKTGERYTIEKNLGELEVELSSQQFFRANRKFIVNIDAIKSFKPSFKGKIAIELMHLSKAEVSISQENANQFRKWIEE